MPRTKVLDVAQAERSAYWLAVHVCENLATACLEQRLALLRSGFPVGHALCELIDSNCRVWAAQSDQFRRQVTQLEADNNL
jgi:hypothetical protein